jgi:arginase
MRNLLGLIGVPTSAGAFAPGQEQAPRALRAAGLIERLGAAGIAVIDHGDSTVRRWQPDRANPFAQNADLVADVARETAGRVARVSADGHLPLVLGGDCTIEIGVVAGMARAAEGERLALLYFDLHPDLNLPAAPGPGALDWTGMAHMLGEEGAVEALARVGERYPLIRPEQAVLFAYGPERATPREREAIERLGLRGIPVDDVASDPEGTAAAALAVLKPVCDRLLVHFDVDTVDFTDLPLSEETGRNQGLLFDVAMRALRTILRNEKLAALAITELNPLHGADDGSTIRAFVEALVDALAGSP